MGYHLGVDLGTTFVAAALATDSRIEMFTLGDRSVVSPSVVYLREDGELISGEAAARRAVSSPDRVGREFKRRLGDPTPVILSGRPYAVTTLLGTLLDDVLTRVTETEGVKPDSVILTHPANWGPFRRELFDEVPRAAGLAGTRTVTEPEAAAAHYAASRNLADGEIIAVYDLGGGTFDATVLRKHPGGIEILGTPEGIERLGGVDFDESIMSYINYAGGGALSDLDLSDAQTGIALARLRQDCVLAKESLSVDNEATIPVFLPNRHFDVTITRPEFEKMIRASIESTIGTLIRTVQSAQVAPSQLAAVLLVGGSSRIPLVAQMISEELGRPTVVDAHPKYAVALGAATLALAGAGTPLPDTTLPGRPERLASGKAGRSASLAPPEEPSTRFAPPPSRQQTAVPRPRHSLEAAQDPAPPGPDRTTPTPPPTQPPSTAAAYATPTPEPQPAVQQPAYSTGTTGAGSGTRVALVVAAVVILLAAIAGAGWFLLTNRAQTAAQPSGAPPAAAGQAPVQAPVQPQQPAIAIVPSVPVPSLGQTVQAGQTPGFVVVSPNGRQAYVANRTAGVVTVIDTAVNKVTATIPVSAGPPQFLAFAPDGRRVYVSVWNDQRTIAAIAVLDTTTNAIVATIDVDTRPFLAAVSRDGKWLYVPNHDSGSVSVIDTTTNQLTATITVAPNPHWVEFSLDGTRAYLANHESGVVTVLNTADNSEIARVPVDVSPHSIAVHPNRPLVANVNYDSNSVTMIDTDRNEVVARIPVGSNPQDITWAPDGRFAYTANVDDNTVSVISVDSMAVTATLPAGTSPTAVAVSPDGRTGYVTNLGDGTITLLNLAG